MSTRHINDCIPVEQDVNLGPPQTRWRNHLVQLAMVVSLAVFAMGSVVPATSLADTIENGEQTVNDYNVEDSDDTVGRDSADADNDLRRGTRGFGSFIKKLTCAVKSFFGGGCGGGGGPPPNYPPTVTLSPPTSNGNVYQEPQNITLRWSGSDPNGDSLSYTVSVTTAGETIHCPKSGNSCTISAGSLKYGKSYYCMVTVSDGRLSQSSSPWGFSIRGNEPPMISNQSPIDGFKFEEEELKDVTLQWIGNDREGDPITYNVFFGTTQLNCGAGLNNSPPTCVIPKEDLELGKNYFWRVQAKDRFNGGENTTEGEIWGFTTRDNLPPEPPTYIAPASGTEDIEPTEDLPFSWNATTDPDGDDLQYQRCHQKDGGDTATCSPEQTSLSKTLPANSNDLEYGTAYNWLVRVKDTAENTVLGDWWTFTTKAAPIKLLLEAKSGFANTLLEWDISNDSEVASYRILRADAEISVVNNPTTSFLDEEALTAGTEYCYRVDALDVNGKSLYQSNSSCVTSGVTTLTMKNSGGLKGEEVPVPVLIPNAGGLQIGSSDIWLRYDGDVIAVKTISKTAITNDYSFGKTIQDDVGSMKIIKISIEYNGAGDPPPIQGEGSLVDVIFDVIGDNGSSSPLELVEFVPGQGGSMMYDHEDNEIPLNLPDSSFNVTRRGTRDGNNGIPNFYVGEAYVRGDLNGNGTIQTVDARIARKIGVGKVIPSEEQLTAGDVNDDGMVDSVDASMIIHYALYHEWPSVDSTNTRRGQRDGNNEPIVISLDDVNGVSGAEIQTTLYINNLTDLTAMNVAIVYDPNVVEKVVTVEGTGLATDARMMFYDDGNGTLRIGLDSQTPIIGSGAFATITLQLATGGNVRSKPLSIANAHLYDIAGRDFAISALQRKIEAHNGEVVVNDVEEPPVIEDDSIVIPIELLSGTSTTYSASSTVTNQQGEPISGVTVQIDGKTATTDDTGHWKIDNLTSDNYVATPHKDGYTFIPEIFAIENGNATVDFKISANSKKGVIGTYIVHGYILNPKGGVTVQIGDKTAVTNGSGYWKVEGLNRGTYDLTAQKGSYKFAPQRFTIINADLIIKVETDGPHSAAGTIADKFHNPIAGVTVKVGNETTVTDEMGNWKITGLFEGEYLAIASKDGYVFALDVCGVSRGQPDCDKLDFEPESVFNVQVVPNPRPAKQGENVTYTITVVNYGDATATGVTLTDSLPQSTVLVSIELLGDGNCDADTVTCSLPDLTPGAIATAKVVISNTQADKLENTVTVTSNEYPADIKTTWTNVAPYLSVSITDTPDPIVTEKVVHYEVDVELSHFAPTSATGVELVMTLPSGVTLKSLNSDHSTCDSSQSPILICSITNLSIDSADSISHVKVDVDVTLEDAGLLMLTHEAKVTANEYPAHINREHTKIYIPEDIEVDIAFVVDVTGSMQEEINGVINALKAFIAEINPSDAPLVALVVFTDDVKVKAFTRDMNVLLRAVERLKADGGGTCPEASADALLIAIPHTKQSGSILFSTDASPYDDADIDGITEQLLNKGIRFNAMITGDCSQKDSWNELPSAE